MKKGIILSLIMCIACFVNGQDSIQISGVIMAKIDTLRMAQQKLEPAIKEYEKLKPAIDQYVAINNMINEKLITMLETLGYEVNKDGIFKGGKKFAIREDYIVEVKDE